MIRTEKAKEPQERCIQSPERHLPTAMIVPSLNDVWSASCSISSVRRSTDAVASSKTNILLLLRMARARHKSCRWPTEKLLPPSETKEFQPLGSAAITLPRCASSSAFCTASSEWTPNRSKFSRTVQPLNKVGTWGITDIFVRSAWRPSFDTSTPSTRSVPSSASSKRKRVCTTVDFPGKREKEN